MGRGAWGKTPEKKKLQEKQGVRDKERERDRERGWGEREQEKEGREEEKGREGRHGEKVSERDRGKQMPWILRTFECEGKGEGAELGGGERRGGERRGTREVSSPPCRNSCAAPSGMGPCSGMRRCWTSAHPPAF